MKQRPIIALIYDFDGTLSPGNMQEFSFIKATGVKTEKQFWIENSELARKNDASEILCYMKLMLEKAKSNGISLKREQFKKFGKDIELFKGVKEWFGLINKYGKDKGVTVEHYINSSGLIEMIEGTTIAKEFKKIYACSFLYSIDGIAEWPAVAVDYTTKTQFLFKINKGIDSISDNKKINEYKHEDERRIPFSHMIYLGDGDTDVPCMKLTKQKGGHSIAVYKPRDKKKKITAKRLITENRANFACLADYSENGEIYKVITTIIDKVKSDYDFKILQKTNNAKLKGKKPNV